MDTLTDHVIRTIDALVAHYDPPAERSLKKELHALDAHCRAFIAASPFMLLATHSEEHGTDCSPRGDFSGFVRVADEKTLLIPDRRGNNRIDSLRNIVLGGTVGMLFLVPGASETLRVNGRAELSTDPELLRELCHDGKEPKCVIVVHISEAFAQCARAVVRSDLWNPEKHAARSTVPSMGEMLEAHTGLVKACDYDAEAKELIPKTLY